MNASCLLCDNPIPVESVLCDEHAHRSYRFTYKCVDCDRVVEARNVSAQVFKGARDRAWHQLERMGEDDFSPTVEESEIVYYNQQCQTCKEEEDCFFDNW
jgi:RecB family exonuclease